MKETLFIVLLNSRFTQVIYTPSQLCYHGSQLLIADTDNSIITPVTASNIIFQTDDLRCYTPHFSFDPAAPNSNALLSWTPNILHNRDRFRFKFKIDFPFDYYCVKKI